MGESNTFFAQVKRSLAKATTPEPSEVEIEPTASIPCIESERVVAPRSVVRQSHAVRLSISLYQSDLDRMDEIKSFMAAKGVRNLSDSEALRLACRSVRLSDALKTVYDAMAYEQRRVQRPRTGE